MQYMYSDLLPYNTRITKRDRAIRAIIIFSLLLCGPHGVDFLVAGLFFTNYPPQLGEDPPVEDPGLCDPPGEPGWLSW